MGVAAFAPVEAPIAGTTMRRVGAPTDRPPGSVLAGVSACRDTVKTARPMAAPSLGRALA